MDKLLIVWFAFCVFYIHVEANNLQFTSNKSVTNKTVQVIKCTSTGTNQWEQQSHPSICGWFVLCMNDIGIVGQCPGNLLFNPDIGICDLYENVNCDDSTTTAGPDKSTTETTVGDEFTTETSVESTTENDTTVGTTTENDSTVDTTTEDDTTVDTTTEDNTTVHTTTEGDTTVYTTTENGSTVDTTIEDNTTVDTTTENDTSVDTTTQDDTTVGTTATTDQEETTTDPNEPETTTDQSETTSIDNDVTTDEIDSTVEDETTEGTTEGATESDCEPLCAGLPPSGGEIADPNHCGRFISCTDQCNGGTMFCPSDLHFNHIMAVCDLPERAECLLEVCVGQPNGVIPSVNSCRHYYACMNSNAILQGCGSELVFDPVLESCVMEDANNACTFPEIPPPPAEVILQCTTAVIEQQLRHPTRCDVFYRCVRGMLSSRICLEGLLFDEMLGKCNLAELVDCVDETEQK